MWIRSQDRHELVNLDNVTDIHIFENNYPTIEYHIVCDGCEFGAEAVAIYSSEDQALVRLGQIQDNLRNCIDVMQMPENVESWKDKGSRKIPQEYGAD